MLGPYAGNEAISQRITMLEGPSFAQELIKLIPKLKTTCFSAVFRDTKISPRMGSFSANSSNGTISRPQTWATTIAVRPAVPTSPRPAIPLTVSSHSPTFERRPSADVEEPIPRNNKGQRVDIPLKFNQNLLGSIKARKYCITICSASARTTANMAADTSTEKGSGVPSLTHSVTLPD